MEKYTQQLLQQIEAIILKRWQKCLPHYFEAGIPNKYLSPPKGWQEGEGAINNPDSELYFGETIFEMETWLEGKAELSMFYHFDLDEQQFPPPERLNDEQLDRLTFALHRLWNAFNFTAVVPENAPGSVVYPILLKRMLAPAMVMSFGHIGVEFCDYEPEQCPFGKTWCSCIEMHKEWEENYKKSQLKETGEKNAGEDLPFNLN